MHPTRFILAAALAFTMSGCASQKSQPTTQFDFGPAASTAAQDPAPAGLAPAGLAPGPLGPVVVADVTGSSALDNERMFYRLTYADPLQARTYAHSRWTANPLQLLTQRFKTRLAQAGARVLSETDASIGIPLLRIDVDEFIQDFGGVSQSTGVVAVRASVFRGHTLVDQRSFRQAVPATSADAAGGARALAAGTDAVAADIAAWLRTLNDDRR